LPSCFFSILQSYYTKKILSSFSNVTNNKRSPTDK
jgi:hypothetical protein